VAVEDAGDETARPAAPCGALTGLVAELGGEGGGTNPEELFAVGFASCFESAIGAQAKAMTWRARR